MPEASNPSTKARHTAGALSTVIIPETEKKSNPSDKKIQKFFPMSLWLSPKTSIMQSLAEITAGLRLPDLLKTE